MARIALFLAILGCLLAAPLRADPPADEDLESVYLILNFGTGGVQSTGTGFAISPDLVLTNHHVIKGGRAFGIVPANSTDGKEARLVWEDADADMAILKVDGLGARPLSFSIDEPDKGDVVWAVGFPGDSIKLQGANQGIDTTLTDGRISSKYQLNWTSARKLVDVVQHTAEISGGNSGGPLIDDCGRVIGINTAESKGSSNLFIATQASEIASRMATVPGGVALNRSGGECKNGVIATQATPTPQPTQTPDVTVQPDPATTSVADQPAGERRSLPSWVAIAGGLFALSLVGLLIANAANKSKGASTSKPVAPPPPAPPPPSLPQEWSLASTSGALALKGDWLSQKQGVSLGRSGKFNDIVVDSDNVSRRHCRFSLSGGALCVEDLNSSNGTLVNGERIKPFRPRRLTDADIVSIAGTVYRIGRG